MLNKFLFLSLILFFLLSGCEKKNKIEMDQLSDIYLSILFAEDSLSYSPDSLKSVRDKIFEENAVSEKDYLSVLESFKSDKEKWVKFFDVVNSKLDSMLAAEDSLRKEREKKIKPKKLFSENEKSRDAAK